MVPVLVPAPQRRCDWSPTEWGFLLYFSWMTALALIMQDGLFLREWAFVNGLALLYLGGLRALRGNPARLATRWSGQVTRQLIALLVLIGLAYREAGTFGDRLAPSIEAWLIRTDLRWFGVNWAYRFPPQPGLLTDLMQSIYLINYVLLLLGIVLAANLNGRILPGRRRPNRLALLQGVSAALFLGLLLCYVAFPFLPAITPRLYFAQLRLASSGAAQDLNWMLLARFSTPSGILPSGHVAGPVALACAFWAQRYRGWGIFFLISAVLIAVATVYGDYHFVADALAGAGAGVVGWAAAQVAVQHRSWFVLRGSWFVVQDNSALVVPATTNCEPTSIRWGLDQRSPGRVGSIWNASLKRLK